MADTIMFEMDHNNLVRAAGKLWTRTGCIPMGGSFSVQAANLHSLWGVYKNRQKVRALGDLQMSDEGFAYWTNEHGAVALCRFKDNILIATSYPDSPTTRVVELICRILESSWGLAVLCDCRQKQADVCNTTCHGTSCVALGYSLHRGAQAGGTAFVQPSALNSQWSLKLPPPPPHYP